MEIRWCEALEEGGADQREFYRQGALLTMDQVLLELPGLDRTQPFERVLFGCSRFRADWK